MNLPEHIARSRRKPQPPRPSSHWRESCENPHGPDGVIACWSPGGPCERPDDPACEMCGPCFVCTDRPDPCGGAA